MSQVETLIGGWEPETPVEDSILRQFVYAYADRVTWMAGARGGQVDRDALACIADARSPFGYDNAAVLLQPPGPIDPVAILQRARALFAPERWCIVLSAWPLPELSSRGLSLVGHPPLMLRLPPAPAVPRPPGLRIVAVEDDQTCHDFDRVLKEGYGLPDSPAVTDQRLLGRHLHLFVGYLGDQPVATAGASTAAGVVEVDWVASLPAHRHRGIGAAMTAAAVSIEPSWPALLLASDDGHNLYRRLGFVDLLRFTIWEHQPLPADTERRNR